MIFAAGLGTRLYPITKDKPKALAPLGKITLLENAINYLSKYGFNDIIINTHHFSDKVFDFLHNNPFSNIKIHISHEEVLLDTAGGLTKAAPFFDERDFLIYNVDIVTDIDLGKMLEFHKLNHADITLAVQKRNTSRYLLFDESKRMQGWINKATGEKILGVKEDSVLDEMAFGGIHIMSPTILPLLGEIRKWSLIPFYLQIAEKQRIMGYEVGENNHWFDCGKPETLAMATHYYKSLTWTSQKRD